MALSIVGMFCSMISVLVVSVALLSSALSFSSPHPWSHASFAPIGRSNGLVKDDAPWAAITGEPMIRQPRATPRESADDQKTVVSRAEAANNIWVESSRKPKRKMVQRSVSKRWVANARGANTAIASDFSPGPFQSTLP